MKKVQLDKLVSMFPSIDPNTHIRYNPPWKCKGPRRQWKKTSTLSGLDKAVHLIHTASVGTAYVVELCLSVLVRRNFNLKGPLTSHKYSMDNKNRPDVITSLPEDIWIQLLGSYFTPFDLCNTALVSK